MTAFPDTGRPIRKRNGTITRNRAASNYTLIRSTRSGGQSLAEAYEFHPFLRITVALFKIRVPCFYPYSSRNDCQEGESS